MPTLTTRRDRIVAELRAHGLPRLWRIHPSSQHLDYVLDENEHIRAVIGGIYRDGRALMVATGSRMILIGHRPLFTSYDELSFAAVRGLELVEYGHFSSVILYTPLGDYRFNKVNVACAKAFCDFIEQKSRVNRGVSQH